MAVLNSILRGQLKGKIGNQWFAHTTTAKGRPATVVGTINSSPKNPRTAAQMTQRAKFANAVKFYKHATENFFRFAFEDKRANESDYNAFMRHNIERSLLQDKGLVDSFFFPALASEWLLSEGTLPYDSTFGFDSNCVFGFYQGGQSIGDLSSSLMRRLGYLKGDIVTVVMIATPYKADGTLNERFDTPVSPQWRIYQFVINPDDLTKVKDMSGVGAAINDDTWIYADNEVYMSFSSGQHVDTANFVGLVVTRKTRNGLKCTTSKLLCSEAAQKLIQWAAAGGTLTNTTDTSNSNLDEILQSWNVGNTAILEGSISDDSSSSDGSDSSNTGVALINDVNGKSLPYKFTNAELGGSNAVLINGQNLGRIAVSDFVGTGCTVDSFAANNAGTQGTLKFTVASDGNTGQIVYKPASGSGELKVMYWDSVTTSGNVDI